MLKRTLLSLKFVSPARVSVRNRDAHVADFTGYRHTDTRPVVFTPKLPEALEGVDLNSFVSVFDKDGHSCDGDEGAMARLASEAVNSTGFQQLPIVPLTEDEQGLPDTLVAFMKSKGFGSLTPVQAKALRRMYARHDAAICAPTGSGKTFAFCLGVMARLIRDGPPKVMSIVILTPSNELCHQIERWLREMWLWPDDPRLCLVLNDETRDLFAYRALTLSSEERDQRPYIIIATPSKLLTFCEARERAILQKRPRHDFTKTPIFHVMDTLIIDEVDDVLIPHDHSAPGNVLLRNHLIHSKYQAPVQRVFVSATLSATTVNHIRRFLRKSLLAHTAVHLFENEIKEVNKATGGARANSSRLTVPETIRHEAFSADSMLEQSECVRTVIQRDIALLVSEKRVAMERASPEEAGAIGKVPLAPLKCAVIIPSSTDIGLFTTEVLGRAWPDGVIDAFYLGKERSATERAARDAMRSIISDVADEGVALGEAASHDSSPAHGKTAGPGDHGATAAVTFYLCRSEAARGLDISGLTHVFIMSVPTSALEFTHFVGRVGRMGRSGTAVTISPRGGLRALNTFCEVANIKMNLHKRLAPV